VGEALCYYFRLLFGKLICKRPTGTRQAYVETQRTQFCLFANLPRPPKLLDAQHAQLCLQGDLTWYSTFTPKPAR
jgi:hypothetical protein